MKIYCHNVRVWTRDRDKTDTWYWRKRMAEIRNLIIAQDPDVLCLQELSFPADRYIPKGYRRVGMTASHPIYVRKGTKTRRHRFYIHFDAVDALIAERWVTIINVHLHWNKAILALAMRQINNRIESALERGNEIIICGDFNNGYKTIYASLPQKELLHFAGDGPTFRNKNTGAEGYIDYFFASLGLKGAARNLGFTRNGTPLSDHQPITYTI